MIKLITNATVESLIKKTPDGLEKSYLLVDNKNRVNRIIHIANELNKNSNGLLSIEAKYKYGFRNVRIEIAFFDGALFLIKIVNNFRKIDKESIKLNSIISKMKSDYKNIQIFGCIILDCLCQKNIIDNVKKLLTNKFIFVDINKIEEKGINAIKEASE